MPLRESQIVALLWDLVDGHCDLPTTVAKLEERSRRPEPAVDWRREWRAPAAAVLDPGGQPPPPVRGPEPPQRDQARARADLRLLLDLRTPAARRAAIDRSTRGMASPRLVEDLLDEAVRVRGPAPRLALALADAALRVAHRVSAEDWSLDERFRLVLRVQAHRANLMRILGELPAADALWRWITAYRKRLQPGLPAERAELFSLEASLRIGQRQFAVAEELLIEAERLYESAGDPVGAAKALLQKGTAAEYSGDGERALAGYERAADLLDPAAEPFLYLASQQNRASALVDLGRPHLASEVLRAHRDSLELSGDPPLRERWRWTEVRIAAAEGRVAEAAVGFDQVCNGFLSLQRPYDAALALLDAAELHLARDDWREVQRLAGRLEAVFTVRGVYVEARKALILFQEAIREERLTITFLARLRRFLLLGRHDPRFAFEPDAAP